MAKSLEDWIDTDVEEVKAKSVSWLSEYYFFRDPPRPSYTDLSLFFAPTDGVILYQKQVKPDDCLVEIKGQPYSLREAMGNPHYEHPSLVIGIFMTFYDVHVNRIPYPGRLSYRLLDPIDSYNHPMLDVEHELLHQLRVRTDVAEYMRRNQRMLNRVDSTQLGQSYYMLQIADYDVDKITPFQLRQNQPFRQCERFSQIRFGSQFDLIIPLSEVHTFTPVHPVGYHVEGGVDPLVSIQATNKAASLVH